ncbi:hypothetical protein BJ878DRAFT_109570 [Calycina marina]|uniref:Uncharacterized protein n=1 Tax=Calycina marina TaxID=1763456 RepID=A0A9P8CE22_9HELO|nr:hypothetical protein BJ878DRAFT_109570 [Calycina marina]
MTASIFRLEEVIFEQILDYVSPASRELIDIDDKRSMSVESFATVSVPVPVDHDIIDVLYEVFRDRPDCPHFRVPLLRRKFARVSTRFSVAEFDALRDLCRKPSWCNFVLKFSYMVHGFSSLSVPHFERLLKEARANHRPNSVHTIEQMMRRTQEQNTLIRSNTDQARIQTALQTFSGLQQIRLMHIQDQIERDWNSFVRTHRIPNESEQHRWARASEHAAKSLGQAYLSASSSASRISIRNLQTSILISRAPHTTFQSKLMHLSSMEIQFDNRPSLDAELLELSTLFQQGFASAINLKGLHLGFARPITTSFAAVFHNVYWSKLRYFGIGPWHLTSDDITTFLLRHRESLKCVRLRGVLLKEGSEWLDVVKILRRDLTRLKWVSLRSVGYSKDVPMHGYPQDDDEDTDEDNYLSEESDSTDTEESDDEGQTSNTNPNGPLQDVSYEETDDDEIDDEASYHGSETDDSEAGTVNQIALEDEEMLRHITSRTDLVARCKCSQGYGWDDLESDDLQRPPKELWKSWQTWISSRCEKHDPPSIIMDD